MIKSGTIKMFGVSKSFYNHIDEFEVIKETEKQFILLNENKKKCVYRSQCTINKSKMENVDYIFTRTLEEAREIIKEQLKNAIRKNYSRIEYLKSLNQYLASELEILMEK